MAHWGMRTAGGRAYSHRAMPTTRFFGRLLNRLIEEGLAKVGSEAVRIAKTAFGAPKETGSLRTAQRWHTGTHKSGPWLALGWDTQFLQRTKRQHWKKLGGPQAPRKAKSPGAVSAAKGAGAGTQRVTGAAGGLRIPSVGRGKYRSPDGPGKYFDYGTYQYMGKDWRSGRKLRYKQGGLDHWYEKHMSEDNAMTMAGLNRALSDAVDKTVEKMWGYV